MEERFWSKVNKTDTCWLWKSSINPKSGYGSFVYKQHTKNAHRLSWVLSGNIIPEGHDVCHASHEICGNRHCVNPAHLRTDTRKANMADKIADGTTNRGHNNPQSILTEDQVRAIRANPENKTQEKLAEQYHVNRALISMIINRKRWAWLV